MKRNRCIDCRKVIRKQALRCKRHISLYLLKTNPRFGFKKGHKPFLLTHSEETRKKLRQINLGRICTEETKKKISEKNKGGSAWNKGLTKKDPRVVKYSKSSSLSRKGKTPWNKNIPNSVITRQKISATKQGIDVKNWKGNITPINLAERIRFRDTFQKFIFERDNYTCQLCGARGGVLQVDHIQSWADYVELRFDPNNCRTLCMDCHYFITFGKPKPKEVKTWGHNFVKGVYNG